MKRVLALALLLAAAPGISNDAGENVLRLGRPGDAAVYESSLQLTGGPGPSELRQSSQNYLVSRIDVLRGPPGPEQTVVRNNLQQVFNRLYGSDPVDVRRSLEDCVVPASSNPTVEEILALLERTREGDRCGDLSPGQHWVIRANPSDPISANYLLKRRQDGNYQAIIEMNFTRGANAHIAPEEMQRRVRACMRQASSVMRGPDGRTLEVVVADPEDVRALPWGQRPAMNYFRDHSRAYSSNIDCSTIVHEVLHPLGLCDEYEEESPLLRPRVSCRVVVRTPSIMRRHDEVYPRAVRTAVACRCVNSLSLQGIMNGPDQNLRQRFVMATLAQILPIDFRRDRCTSQPFGGPLIGPSKNVVLLPTREPNAIVLDARNMSYRNRPPFFVMDRVKLTCRCGDNDPTCGAILSRIRSEVQNPPPRIECPDNTETDSALAQQLNEGSALTASGTVQNGSLVLVSEPRMSSLLQTAHSYRILEGTCRGVARKTTSSAPFGRTAVKIATSRPRAVTIPFS